MIPKGGAYATDLPLNLETGSEDLLIAKQIRNPFLSTLKKYAESEFYWEQRA